MGKGLFYERQRAFLDGLNADLKHAIDNSAKSFLEIDEVYRLVMAETEDVPSRVTLDMVRRAAKVAEAKLGKAMENGDIPELPDGFFHKDR